MSASCCWNSELRISILCFCFLSLAMKSSSVLRSWILSCVSSRGSEKLPVELWKLRDLNIYLLPLLPYIHLSKYSHEYIRIILSIRVGKEQMATQFPLDKFQQSAPCSHTVHLLSCFNCLNPLNCPDCPHTSSTPHHPDKSSVLSKGHKLSLRSLKKPNSQHTASHKHKQSQHNNQGWSSQQRQVQSQINVVAQIHNPEATDWGSKQLLGRNPIQSISQTPFQEGQRSPLELLNISPFQDADRHKSSPRKFGWKVY